MCKEELNQGNELMEDKNTEEFISSEELMELLSVQEEEKRIEIQENPKSKTSKETKLSDFYKESMITVETIGDVFQKLLGYGIDYNNALALANNLVTNDVNLKISKTQQITLEQNQI